MKIIVTGSEARKLLKQGIDKVTDAVKQTLGPSGRNAIIGRKFLTPLTTNDGVSVAKSIVCDNEIEELGAQLVKEVGKLTDDSVGDGTTTASVLLQAVLNAGMERLENNNSLIDSDVDPIAMKKEIDVACALVVKELKERATPISTVEEMERVAFVSVENKDLAKLVAKMYSKIGKDGVITLEDGGYETTSEIVEGMEIKVGYCHPGMANNSDGELIMHNPKVIVSNIPVFSHSQIKPIVSESFKQGFKDFIFIVADVTSELLMSSLDNKLKLGINIHYIKSPFANNKERMTDLAIKFGTVFIDRELKMTIEDTPITFLGTIDKVIATKNKTILIGGSGDIKDRVKELNKEIEQTMGVVDKKRLQERLADLTGGIGIIRVGSQSDSEREYWKLKVQDCIGSVKSALQEGVVKGGGLTLKEISDTMPNNILSEALKAPYNQIQKNVGHELIISDDIIDPVKVTRTSLQNACSLAGMIITTEIAVADKNEKEDKK